MQETFLYLRDLWRHGVLGLPTAETDVAEILRPFRVFGMMVRRKSASGKPSETLLAFSGKPAVPA